MEFLTNYCSMEERKRTLKIANTSYTLTRCKWRQMTTQKRKSTHDQSHIRLGHGASIIKSSLYLFGGNKKSSPELTFRSLSLRTSEWKEWTDYNSPLPRDSAGMTTHCGEIYLFGGSNYVTQFNDMHFFNTMIGKWKELDNPLPACNPMVFIDVYDTYILFLGGIDVHNKIVVDDAYVFYENRWLKINILNYPQGLVEAKTAVCGSRVFLFGGELTTNTSSDHKYLTDLYEVKVDIDTLTIKFQTIETRSEVKPLPRFSHSMVGISKDYFVLLGGTHKNLDNTETILRDLWLYDVKGQEWLSVQFINGLIKPISQCSLSVYGNALYVVGGMTSQANNKQLACEEVTIIEFIEEHILKAEMCSNCVRRAHKREQEIKKNPKTMVVSIGFLYNLALQIKHPFEAIGMLYHCSQYLEASTVNFRIPKTVNNFEYLHIDFDGNTLTTEQFENMLVHSESDPELYRFFTRLKLASMRLGKTLLFITADKDERKVMMLSADSKVSPAFDESFSYFAYIEPINSEIPVSNNYLNQRTLIMNVLKSRVEDFEEVLQVVNGSRLLVLETNIVMTANKVYYYELIAQNNEDIRMYCNDKKVTFLDSLGYYVSEDPELSLKAYIGHSLLPEDPAKTIFIINDSLKVLPTNNYLNKIAAMCLSGMVTEIPLPEIENCEISGKIFFTNSKTVVRGNHGLLIYYKGELVNRFGTRFGSLFKEEFYKTKFKKATTVFPVFGVINVLSGLTLNLLGNWFKKDSTYYAFQESFDTLLHHYKEQQLQDPERWSNETTFKRLKPS